MRELEDLALAFDEACTKAGVDYVFVGGLAVLAWGQPRATMDVDVLLVVPEDPGRFVEELGKVDLDIETWELDKALETSSHATVFDERSSFHVDVKPALTRAELGEIERARSVPFEGRKLPFAPPEDVVAFKLSFGTAQDVQDARSILARQFERLDREALEKRAREQGVSEELSELLEEVRRELGTGEEA